MSDLQIFDVSGSDMRFGISEDGRPYVVAEDFTPQVGYSRARNALRMVDEDEKGAQIVSTPGGDQRMDVLYEDGIWELIFLSRKPEAKAIKKRVKAILKEIRETGSYSVTPITSARPLPASYSEALRALADLDDAHEVAKAELNEIRPAADAWNELADAKGDYDLREAAQILCRDPRISTGQNRLAAYLRTIGWTDRNNIPYQAQVDNGRLDRRPTSFVNKKTGAREKSTQVRIQAKGLKEIRLRMTGQDGLFAIEGGA